MKFFLSTLLPVFFFFNGLAQQPTGMNGNIPPGRGPGNIGHVFGKVVDTAGKAISEASVILLQSRLDTVTKKSKDVLLKGMTAQKNGDFSFEDLPVSGNFTVKISATGYSTTEQKISFRPAPGVAPSFDKDLGKIKLLTDTKELETVIVTANTSSLRLDIDKKVFTVDKNIVSAGGTALDVMKNVPSINVDIDGNVSLRNAAPQLFVDGRPTTLSLDQIPADAIESVEVITNPSAKYDASGGGAGILNIVLKKNKKTGYNGNIRAGIDKRGALNGGFDFNARQNKVNFFGSINVNQMKGRTTGTTDRFNFLDSPQTIVNQVNNNKTSGAFVFGRAGLDYFLTNRTTLSLAGFKVRGEFNPYELININTDSLYQGGMIQGFRDRLSTGNRVFNGQGLSFGMKYLFPKAGEELTFDANYFSGKSENNAFYTTNNYAGVTGSTIKGTTLQKILGDGNDWNFILQSDYIKPVNTKTKLEAGLRAAFRSRENNNNNYTADSSGAYILIPNASSNYNNNDNVYAAYASITSSIKNFGYKIGLRAESSNYQGELVNNSQKFSNSYPVSLFPSIFLSQKLNNSQELQLSYTRRINRPNFFQLIPFVDYSDELNITQGNPGLVPEFTNSLEMSYLKTFNGKNTFLSSVYYKKTTDLITRFLDKGVNPFTGKDAIINTYINANSSQSYGAEFTTQIFPVKWWDFTTNVNVYNSAIDAGASKTQSQVGMWSWFGKVNNNFKLPSDFSLQLSASYQSKTNLLAGSGGGFGGPPGARGGSGGGPGGGGGGFGQAQSASQGYIKSFYSVDIAVKKSFLKNKAASAILSFSDIFRTKITEQHSESDYFIQDYSRLRDPQMVRLTLTYRFGKVDASLFKRKSMGTENTTEGMQ
ncbi:MAG: TonB-dependent receptor [Chitinophagaceae bacterium]|nr:TonB-dependent receptor [Chitinophagaceae bacterium]